VFLLAESVAGSTPTKMLQGLGSSPSGMTNVRPVSASLVKVPIHYLI